MEKMDMTAAEMAETKKTLKTEAEKNARMDDLVAKGKKGKLSESDLDQALEEMDYDIDSLDKLYESLEDGGIPLPELSGTEMSEIESEVERFGNSENMQRILEQARRALSENGTSVLRAAALTLSQAREKQAAKDAPPVDSIHMILAGKRKRLKPDEKTEN